MWLLDPPEWCSHAVPTRRGWVDPYTGEIVETRRISDIDIQNYRDNTTQEEDLLNLAAS
jgi:hypothetical protein